MTKSETLLMHVRHVKTFLEAAEAALTSSGPDAAKVDVADTCINEANNALPGLIAVLDEAKSA